MLDFLMSVAAADPKGEATGAVIGPSCSTSRWVIMTGGPAAGQKGYRLLGLPSPLERCLTHFVRKVESRIAQLAKQRLGARQVAHDVLTNVGVALPVVVMHTLSV